MLGLALRRQVGGDVGEAAHIQPRSQTDHLHFERASATRLAPIVVGHLVGHRVGFDGVAPSVEEAGRRIEIAAFALEIDDGLLARPGLQQALGHLQQLPVPTVGEHEASVRIEADDALSQMVDGLLKQRLRKQRAQRRWRGQADSRLAGR